MPIIKYFTFARLLIGDKTIGPTSIVIFSHVQQNSTYFFSIMLSRLCIVMKAKYLKLLECCMQLLMEFNEASFVLINLIPCLFFTHQGPY